MYMRHQGWIFPLAMQQPPQENLDKMRYKSRDDEVGQREETIQNVVQVSHGVEPVVMF